MYPLCVAQRLVTARFLLALVAVFGLFACHRDSLTEPEFARVNTRRLLTITGAGNGVRGVVTSDRGGISCTISPGNVVSGKCTQLYKSGAIVTLAIRSAGRRAG